MADPNQLTMELQKAAPSPSLLLGPDGDTVVLHQPRLFPGKGAMGERARLAQGPVPGNETLAGGFVFCENQTHNQAQAAKQSLLGRLAGLLPEPQGTTGSTSCHPGWHWRPGGQGPGPALASRPDPLLPGLNWNRNEKASLSSV